MISIFQKARNWDVSPSKYSVLVIYIIVAGVCALYITAFILYFLTIFCDCETPDCVTLVAISIVEIVITILSIVISVIATRISDHYTNICIERIKKVNQKNAGLFNHQALIAYGKETENELKLSNRIQHAILVFFIIYLASMSAYLISTNTTAIQFLTVTTGAISAIFSIVLGLVSSLSCAISGRYTNLLLSTLDQDTTELFDRYNRAEIDKSHNESGE